MAVHGEFRLATDRPVPGEEMVVAEPRSVSIHVRRSAPEAEFVCPWSEVDVGVLISALPRRTFRWHKGQKHYSGAFWSSTERACGLLTSWTAGTATNWAWASQLWSRPSTASPTVKPSTSAPT